MMKMVIFVTFTPCIVSICGSLLRGQSATENMEWSTIYVAFFSLFYIVELLFMLCYFGNVLTTSLELVQESVYDSKWYTYPLNMQKDCAFMMRSAQSPFWISAFGIMPCTLENFAAVINSAISFFMVMRTMA
ncbi:odorant receptor 4-like [Sitodiplosis mosellana]|uniref:odorant receptor 4-like n=1 Tax=Sitodiplosis mosellana TaxID=263140 RepID=UPI0024437FEA|nr:odorant receptor 4-like [Sitodiplosis mosellana]